MPRVVHFELSVDDPERAIAFYASVFGWTATKWNGPEEYWLVSTGDPGAPGINGAFIRKTASRPSLINTIDVSNLDDTVARIMDHGGRVVLPRMAIPTIGWMAFFTDPDGIMTGIIERDAAAG